MSVFASSLPKRRISKFCRQWKIHELAVFGSVLRDDFDINSDIDILVTFNNDAEWGLFDHVQMQEELQFILGRKVDLISKRGLGYSKNWLRRNEIIRSSKIIYENQEK